MDQYYHPSWRSTGEETRRSLFIIQQKKSLGLDDEETITTDAIELTEKRYITLNMHEHSPYEVEIHG
jgi:hypothetical protein